MGRTEGHRGARGGPSVAIRLVALILIPLLAVGSVSAAVAVSRYQTAHQAEDLRAEVDRATTLIALRSSIRTERIITEIIFLGRSNGIDPGLVGYVLGFNPAEEMPRQQERTDELIAQLGPDAGFVPQADLDRLRASAADGTADATGTAEGFDAHIARLQDPIDEVFAQLDADVARLAGSAEVSMALDAIRALQVLAGAYSDQVLGLENAFLSRGDSYRWHYLSVQGRTAGQAAFAELDHLGLPELRDAWLEASRSADATLLRDTVDEMAEAAPGTVAIDLGRMIAVGRAGWNTMGMIDDLTDEALLTVHDLAVDLEQRAAADASRWSVAAAALIVVMIVVSVRNARAISRPIRRLGDKAASVSAGDLDVPPARRRGPRDIVATSMAFDEVVANLRLLEAKSQALAACELDAPVLAAELPGGLGRSLEESVQVLSASIVERNRLQEHLAHQATHDTLTGLHNRAAAEDALRGALDRTSGTGGGTAVLYIDLDDFKRANDTYGHAVGDEVLREVARRMRATVREHDFLARLGGDEFMVIAENLADAAGATALAHHLIDAVTVSIPVGEHEIPVAACVGIAFAAGDADPDQVLAWADIAVYRAKHRGRGQVEIYDHTLQEELLARAATHDALRRAIDADELVLHYQPVVHADGSIAGVEALVRWERPGAGFQSPADFIPAAESSNLIIDLDRWVLRHAADQLMAWDHGGSAGDLRLAVNVSGRHLLSGLLPRHLAQVLDATGVDPARLTLEITETVLIDDLPTAAFELAQVRDLGVQVAIDDFGTGYTSVMQLQTLPVDVMKIDRSFVSGPNSERDQGVLSMLIDLGHHLGMTVTAEGVETAEQLATLRALGCDHLQGYFISRPVPPDALAAWRPVATPGASTAG